MPSSRILPVNKAVLCEEIPLIITKSLKLRLHAVFFPSLPPTMAITQKSAEVSRDSGVPLREDPPSAYRRLRQWNDPASSHPP